MWGEPGNEAQQTRTIARHDLTVQFLLTVKNWTVGRPGNKAAPLKAYGGHKLIQTLGHSACIPDGYNRPTWDVRAVRSWVSCEAGGKNK